MLSAFLSESGSSGLGYGPRHFVYLGCQAAVKTTPYTMEMKRVVKETTEKNAERGVFPGTAAFGDEKKDKRGNLVRSGSVFDLFF